MMIGMFCHMTLICLPSQKHIREIMLKFCLLLYYSQLKITRLHSDSGKGIFEFLD